MPEFFLPAAGLLLACALLMLGAEILIKACQLFSSALGVSQAFSGITLMSIATSSPEIFVSLKAHLDDHTGLALGNLAGSNIANILLIYGLGCLLFLKPHPSRKLISNTDSVVFALSTLIFLSVLLWNLYGRLTGILLLSLYGGYIAYSYLSDRNPTVHPLGFTTVTALRLGCYSIAGALILYFGSELMIESGSTLARLFQVPEGTIGLTAVALGTSLPELVVLLVSAKRMSEGFIVGNIVGSNIFNIALIPGVMFLLSPLQATISLSPTGLMFFGLSALLFLVKSHLHKRFSPISGIAFLTLYAGFIYIVGVLQIN